jgi:hypothetical protein
VRLAPPSDQTTYFVERARGMLVTTSVQKPEIGRHAQQKTQLIYTEIRLAEMGFPVSREGSRDKWFEHIKTDTKDTVAEHEFLALREAFDCGDEPKKDW